jgi:hypothetical protein
MLAKSFWFKPNPIARNLPLQDGLASGLSGTEILDQGNPSLPF